ncbi:DUF5829 family protein [Aquimarina sp. 2201CG1-2-11]|uniref:DUF5829 family protein n=1 Tax=Aquimarina discodermiae TaxID=3231043 RepID=UPI00346238EC
MDINFLFGWKKEITYIENRFLGTFFRLSYVTLFGVFLMSCQKQKTQSESYYSIDREKIDEAFNKDKSKVLLDHLYVVVDSVTYSRLVNDNRWKNTYASFDRGLPDFAAVNMHASTCYLRGHRHYIEILGPKNTYNESVGKSGIGFSLKNKEEHFHLGLKPKLKPSKSSLLQAVQTVQMPLRDYKYTWFKAFYTPSPGTSLHTWYAFYNPSFLDSLYGKHYTSYSREAFLEPNYKKKKLFNGVKEIYATCTLDDYLRIVQELKHLQCELLQRKGNILMIKGGDVILHIEPSDIVAYSRITKIICELNNADYSITRLGNLIITNQGNKSIWNLKNLYNNNP